MEPLLQLPDLSQNAALLDYLRGQASPPGGPGDYTPRSLAAARSPRPDRTTSPTRAGWPLTAAHGVPLLACEGIAAAAALGTDWLAVRIGHLPPSVETEDPAPEWSSPAATGTSSARSKPAPQRRGHTHAPRTGLSSPRSRSQPGCEVAASRSSHLALVVDGSGQRGPGGIGGALTFAGNDDRIRREDHPQATDDVE